MRNAQVLRERQWLCARRLRDRRRELGLTQCEVVERLAALGVESTNRTLSAIEHGQGVDIGRLPELAVALDCTVTYLLGLTEIAAALAARRPQRAGDRRCHRISIGAVAAELDPRSGCPGTADLGARRMHELALCGAIADVVSRRADGRQVDVVHLRIGALRQVVPDTLSFCWSMVASRHAATTVRSSTWSGCRRCCAAVRAAHSASWSTTSRSPAPSCGGVDMEVLSRRGVRPGRPRSG